MSIYIKGMEMPEKLNNHTIELAENNDGTRFARLSSGFDGWHQVIEVLPHGRLIDANALICDIKKQTALLKSMGYYVGEIADILENGFVQEIENAPSILETEGV